MQHLGSAFRKNVDSAFKNFGGSSTGAFVTHRCVGPPSYSRSILLQRRNCPTKSPCVLVARTKKLFVSSRSPEISIHFQKPAKQTALCGSSQQIRHLGYYKLKKKEKKLDPFEVLGLKEEGTNLNGDGEFSIPYAQVKRKFLKIAMEHHPDTTKATSEEERQKHRDIFVQARQAFEMIVEGGPDGKTAVLKADDGSDESSTNMEDWFRQQTGHEMPFMDLETMKEVAETTERLGGEMGGLDRDGGMWTLARMVSQSVKNGDKNASGILALESGTIKDRAIDGDLRRRRRR